MPSMRWPRGPAEIIAGDFNENEHGDAMQWLGARGYASVLPQFDPSRNLPPSGRFPLCQVA